MTRAKTPGLKKFNIYLPIPVVGALDHLAKLRNATRAELVREALREYAKAELLVERNSPDLEDLVKTTPAPEGTAEVPINLPALRKPEVQLTLQLSDVDPDAEHPDEFPPELTKVENEDGKPQQPQPSGTIRIG